MKSIAIIPAYNEEFSIATVVTETAKYVDKVIVVNDQSIDATAEYARNSGAEVIRTYGKHGAGNAIITGIYYAFSNYNPETIVLIDGDGQHNAQDMPRMLKELDNYEMVVTSRFMDNFALTNMPAYRKFGIQLINLAYNCGARFKVKDSQCGLRAMRSDVLKSLQLQERDFGYSTEMLVKARAMGYKICEIPTVVKYHADFKQNSTKNPLIHGIEVMWMTIKWRLICEVFGRC